MTTIFDDFDDADAFDLEPADPEQVARKLHELRRREGFEAIEFDHLSHRERDMLIAIIITLLAWMRRQGAH